MKKLAIWFILAVMKEYFEMEGKVMNKVGVSGSALIIVRKPSSSMCLEQYM